MSLVVYMRKERWCNERDELTHESQAMTSAWVDHANHARLWHNRGVLHTSSCRVAVDRWGGVLDDLATLRLRQMASSDSNVAAL
eukprot:1736114-Amphidinium_carterae.1